MSEDPKQSPPRRLLFDVWLVSRATAALLDAELAPAGLTADEFALYSALHLAETVTPSQLAELLAIPPTTVSTHIRRLERRGDLARVTNPADRRSALLRLTPAGETAYRRAGALFAPIYNRVAQALALPAPEVQAALAALNDAVRLIRAERELGAAPRVGETPPDPVGCPDRFVPPTSPPPRRRP